MKYKIKSRMYPDELQVIICEHCYDGSELSYDPQITVNYGVGDCVVCKGIPEEEYN